MDPNPERRMERILTGLFLGGFGLMFFGVLGAVIFSAPSMRVPNAFSILMGCAGLLMVGLAACYGAYKAFNLHTGPEVAEVNCRVMARYCIDERNNVVSSEWFGQMDGVRTFVRMYSPTKGPMEFECAPPVWMQCGEGMLGRAVTRGKWLSAFQPQMGMRPPEP